MKPIGFVKAAFAGNHIQIVGDEMMQHCVKTDAFKNDGQLFVRMCLCNEKGEDYGMVVAMPLTLYPKEQIG